LLDAFASNAPLPGGGSAAALTGSLGVSLLLMVAGIRRTRSGTPEETADLAAAAARLRPIREELTALIDGDTAAYQQLLTAYRQPKGTDGERSARRDAVAAAARRATEAPLSTMRACQHALREAVTVVRCGNPNAVTDAAVGARLLVAALESAAMNVLVNLPGVGDPDFAESARAERTALLSRAAALSTQVDAALGQ
jgi:glutamate formiminotransferase/formiminotetrahydrofolate cyclodeaminase